MNKNSVSYRMWSRELIKHLIDEYKKYEMLYDPNHNNYINHKERQICLEEICKSLKKYNTGITVDRIKKKIKNLRSQFTREHRRIASVKSLGKATDESDKHLPLLWCYNDLSFLPPYKPRPEMSNLRRVWKELNNIRRQQHEEMDNFKTSVTYDDESLTSSEDVTSINSTKSPIYQEENLPAPDNGKDDVAIKYEVEHEDPLLMQSSSIPVAKAASNCAESNLDTNSTLNKEANMISLLQTQLQIQTQQLQIINSMFKSFEILSEKQIKAMDLKTAAVERQTVAIERQTAAIEDLMIVCMDDKCDKNDSMDIY